MLGIDVHIWLIDFRIAKVIKKKDYTMSRSKRNVNYLSHECLDSIEIWENEHKILKRSPKVDVWALVVLFLVFSGFVAWTDKKRFPSYIT